jgi:hypothetical protein
MPNLAQPHLPFTTFSNFATERRAYAALYSSVLLGLALQLGLGF